MSKATQQAEFQVPGASPTPGEDAVLGEFPKLPEDVLERFPSMVAWQEEMREAWKKAAVQITGAPVNG